MKPVENEADNQHVVTDSTRQMADVDNAPVRESSDVDTMAWRGAFVDNSALIVLAALLIYTYFFNEPHRRGFWCNDMSIRYPYQPLTISLAVIIVVSWVVPMCVIVYTEGAGPNVRPQLRKFLFSAATNLMLNLFFKFTVGRLRPHFMAVCDPDVDCSANSGNIFVSEYSCRNQNRRAVNQARQSFYSGHASIAMNAAVSGTDCRPTIGQLIADLTRFRCIWCCTATSGTEVAG